MSIEACRCGTFVDTDEDAEAYEVTTEDCRTINLDYALCPVCRENFAQLIKLRETVDKFTQDVFDWVSLLKSVGMLEHLYDFREKIDQMTDPEQPDGGKDA